MENYFNTLGVFFLLYCDLSLLFILSLCKQFRSLYFIYVFWFNLFFKTFSFSCSWLITSKLLDSSANTANYKYQKMKIANSNRPEYGFEDMKHRLQVENTCYYLKKIIITTKMYLFSVFFKICLLFFLFHLESCFLWFYPVSRLLWWNSMRRVLKWSSCVFCWIHHKGWIQIKFPKSLM